MPHDRDDLDDRLFELIETLEELAEELDQQATFEERMGADDEEVAARAASLALAGRFVEAFQSIPSPVSPKVLDLVYPRALLLYTLDCFAPLQQLLDSFLVELEAFAEDQQGSGALETILTVVSTLRALCLDRLGEPRRARAALDAVSAPSGDEELAAWVAAQRALATYRCGERQGVVAAVSRYHELAADRTLRAIEPYRPLLAAARALFAEGAAERALTLLDDARRRLWSNGLRDRDGRAALHEGYVRALPSWPELAAEFADPLAEQPAERFLALTVGRAGYPGHADYATLALCSHLAGELEARAGLEGALAWATVALVGDGDLVTRVGALLEEAEREEATTLGAGLGPAQVADDLARRYLPTGDPLRERAAARRAALARDTACLPLHVNLLPDTLLGAPAKLPNTPSRSALLAELLADPERALELLPYLLWTWPDDSVEAEAWAEVTRVIPEEPLVEVLALFPGATLAHLVGRTRPLETCLAKLVNAQR